MHAHKVAGLKMALSLLVIGTPVNAQFGDLLDSMKSKAADRIRH